MKYAQRTLQSSSPTLLLSWGFQYPQGNPSHAQLGNSSSSGPSTVHQGLSAWSCFSQVLGSTCSTTPYRPLRSWFHSDFTKKTEVTSLSFLTMSSLSPPNSAQKYFPLLYSSPWALSFSFKASGKYQDFPRNLLMHNKCSINVSYYYFYLMILHTESITVLCARTILFVLYCTDH